MSADIQVSRKLNEIINSLTEQGSIRETQLKRLPLCIFYGEMHEELRQLFRMELQSRVGSDYITEFVSALTSEEMEMAVEAAVYHFQEKTESGMIPKVNQIYIPIFFLANQVDAEKLIVCIHKLDDIMRRFGFEGEFEAGFYCIFDYEEMDGNACKEQLETLQKDERCKIPLGIFTQTNMVRTIEQRYLKAIQAISLHIFLQCSSKEMLNNSQLSGSKAIRYTLGYWKLDVLKQRIADKLLEIIENQNRQLIAEGTYYDKIGDNIKKTVDVDLERYQKMFMCMPVKHQRFTGKHYSMQEMMGLLYEDQDAFRHFLGANIPDAGEKEYILSFFHTGVGNLYAVTEQLEGALLKWKEFYSRKRNELSMNLCSQEHILRISKGIKLSDIIGNLCGYFWGPEGEIFQLDRRICFINAVIDYLHSQEFAEIIDGLSLRNRNDINSLKMARSESLLHDGLEDVKGGNSLSENIEIPEWNMDLLSTENLKNAVENISAIMYTWMNDNAESVLAYFAAGVGGLKRQDAMKSYYAARLDIPKSTYEKEYLFLGKVYQKIDKEELRRMVSTQIPRAELKVCEWEAETCLECFAVKEIEDFAEIYAID